MEAVSLNADGTCDPQIDAATDPPLDCSGQPPGPGGDAGTANPIGRSQITFAHLFNGKPDESEAAERLSEAQFELFSCRSREFAPEGSGPLPAAAATFAASLSSISSEESPRSIPVIRLDVGAKTQK
jgi:hypothetical protein